MIFLLFAGYPLGFSKDSPWIYSPQNGDFGGSKFWGAERKIPRTFPGHFLNKSEDYLGMSAHPQKSSKKSCPSRVGGGPSEPKRKKNQKNTCTTSGRRFRKIALASDPCCFRIRFGTDILRRRHHEARRQEKEEDPDTDRSEDQKGRSRK